MQGSRGLVGRTRPWPNVYDSEQVRTDATHPIGAKRITGMRIVLGAGSQIGEVYFWQHKTKTPPM